jgi:hypothetical protein
VIRQADGNEFDLHHLSSRYVLFVRVDPLTVEKRTYSMPVCREFVTMCSLWSRSVSAMERAHRVDATWVNNPKRQWILLKQ